MMQTSAIAAGAVAATLLLVVVNVTAAADFAVQIFHKFFSFFYFYFRYSRGQLLAVARLLQYDKSFSPVITLHFYEIIQFYLINW